MGHGFEEQCNETVFILPKQKAKWFVYVFNYFYTKKNNWFDK